MSVEVSNALLTIEKLYPFPMYIGNEERIEDGVRWVYQTSWQHDGNGKEYHFAEEGTLGHIHVLLAEKPCHESRTFFLCPLL